MILEWVHVCVHLNFLYYFKYFWWYWKNKLTFNQHSWMLHHCWTFHNNWAHWKEWLIFYFLQIKILPKLPGELYRQHPNHFISGSFLWHQPQIHNWLPVISCLTTLLNLYQGRTITDRTMDHFKEFMLVFTICEFPTFSLSMDLNLHACIWFSCL